MNAAFHVWLANQAETINWTRNPRIALH